MTRPVRRPAAWGTEHTGGAVPPALFGANRPEHLNWEDSDGGRQHSTDTLEWWRDPQRSFGSCLGSRGGHSAPGDRMVHLWWRHFAPQHDEPQRERPRTDE